MRVNDSSFSKTFGILQNWFTSGKTFDCSGKGFGFGLYRFVYVIKCPLIISSILRILRQSAKCLNSYFSSCFILQTTCPRSSVTPTLAGPGGRRPPDMWRSRSRSPVVVVATWLEGHSRDMAPGWHVLVLQPGSATRATSTLAYSNRSPSSHGSAMVRLDRRCLILTKKSSKGNSSCCELISHRCATDEVAPAAQPLSAPHFLDNSAFLRCKFKFIRGVSEFSRVD